MRSRVAAGLTAVAVVVGLLAVATPASARKVANPGAVAFTSEAGSLLRVGDEQFDLEDGDLTITGTVAGNGAVTIPRANIVFPPMTIDGPFGPIVVTITANNDATGTLDPLTGFANINASLRIDLDGSPLAANCRIDPVNVALRTDIPAPNAGVPYNPATGRATLVDKTFAVPGARDCGSFLFQDLNQEVNNAAGIPSPSGQNLAVVKVRTTPVIAAAIVPRLVATPTSGFAPLDVDFDATTSTVVAGPGTFAFDLDGNGTFEQSGAAQTASRTYNIPGTYTARLRITDGEGDVATTTRTITVAPNQPPTATPQSVTTPEDTPKAITLAGNDPEGQPLTFAIASGPTNGALSGTGATRTYTPALDFNGTDSFTFTVSDGVNTSAPAAVAITVMPVNDAPVADDQTVTVIEDTARLITLTGSDAEGNPLTFAIAAQPSKGTLSGSGATRGYAPFLNATGADSFTFTVSDGNGGVGTGTVSIDITPVNDRPRATDKSVSTPQDTPLDITLAGTDVDGDTLAVAVVPGSGPTNGTLTGTAPDLTYTPNPGYFGPDQFDFAVTDPDGLSDTGRISISVFFGGNTAPVADDQSVSTDEDTPVDITLTGSDPDAGQTLTYAVLGDGPANGTVDCTGPDCTYTPDADFTGADAFQFTADDGNGGVDTGTVSITVDAVNDDPVAEDAEVSTIETDPVAIALGATDVDGDPLTFAVDGSGPANGTLSGTAPALTYTADAGFTGTDAFNFTVSDGNGGSDTGTVTITVDAFVNSPPVAEDQSVTTDEDTAVAIVLGATDADDQILTYAIVGDGPANGTLSGTGRSFSYLPDEDFSGSDSFDFSVDDGAGGTDTATVSITVEAVNDAPVADPRSVSTKAGTPLAITLTATDVDDDAGDLSYSVVAGEGPSDGTVTGTGADVTYTPDSGFTGADAFTFTVTDGSGATDTARVLITVFPRGNQAPTADDQAVTTAEGTPVDITLTGSDPDDDPLMFSVFSAPSNGTVDGTGALVTYTPADGFSGTDSFSFTVDDGRGGIDTGTVTITVDEAPDPVATSLDADPVLLQLIPLLLLSNPSAELLDADGDPVPGKTITFVAANNGAPLCQAVTNGAGRATCGASATTVLLAGGYRASFAGDADFGPSGATGELIRLFAPRFRLF